MGDRMRASGTGMTGVLVAALLVVAAALPSAAEAQQFGALATGPDGAYGWVNNADSPREADRRALRECGRRCEIRVQFHNTCAAYATGINGASGWQRDDDVEYARRRAVGYCRENGGRDCRVRVWACAR